MTLSAALRESGLLGFAIKGGALSRLATPKVGSAVPPGAGGEGRSDNFFNGAPGGAYNNAGQTPAASPAAGTGGGGGGANAAGGAGSIDSFSSGAAGAAGAAGANGSAGGAGGAASGDAGGGGGGGGGTALSSASYTLNSNHTGGAGGAGGNGSASSQYSNNSGGGGGGGGAGGGGDYVGSSVSLALGTGAVHGGAGGAGGAGFGIGYGGDGGTGGFGFAFVYGGTEGLSVASGGQVTGGIGGAGGVGALFYGEGAAGGAGGVGIFAPSGAFALTNAGTISGGDGGNAGGGFVATALGGAGVLGSGLTITNTGTISGGLAGDHNSIADAITFTGGANVLNLSTGTLSGGIGVTGTLSVDPNDAAMATTTLSNVVHGSGAVTYAGAGMLTLTGADTYTGATTIASGTLALSGGGSIASSTVADAATLDVSGVTSGGTIGSLSGAGAVTLGSETLTLANAADTFSGVISGAGALAIAGGAETLSGANTYTGGTTVTGGATLALGHDTNGLIDAAGAGAVALDGGVLSDTDSNAAQFNNAIVVGAGGGTITTTIGNFAPNGSITGSGTLTFTGAESFAIYGHDAGFSGATIVTGGATLFGEQSNTLSHLSDYEIDSGAGLRLSNGGSGPQASGVLTQTIGSLSGAGTLYDNAALNATLTLGDTQDTTLSGVISDNNVMANPAHTGILSLVKQGTDTFTASGANTYAGGTTISAGEFAVTNSTFSGTAPTGTETSSSVGTGAVTFDGGQLQAGAANLEFENAGTLNATGGGFDVDGQTLTWDGVISNGSGGAANLAVTDTSSGTKGTLVLDAANTYTGGTTVTGGAILTLAHSTGGLIDAAGSGTITLNGGQINGDAIGDALNNTVAIGSNGGVIAAGAGGVLPLQGAITGTGPLTLTGGLVILAHADAGFSGTTHVTGNATVYSDPNNTLAAASDYQVDSGSNLVISSQVQASGAVAETIGSLSGAGNFYIRTNSQATGAIHGTLTLGDAANTTFSGVFSDHPAVGNASNNMGFLSLIKQGSGTFTEAGANLYSGGTTLNAGTLELSHATTGTFGAISSGAAGSGAITFGGGAAKLQIDSVALGSDAAHTFAYAINGFTAGETLEVKDGAGSVDTTTYDAGAGTLTLVNGVNMEAVLHIGTGYSGDTFSAAYDGNNGTDIMVTVPAPPPPPSGGGGGGGSTGGGGDIPSQQGGSGDDTLTAGSGMDTVYGGAGDDHLNGGTGHAMLYGNTGNDTVTLFSYTQESTVYGGQGDDTIDASQSTHANFISGDLGNDSIIGGGGNDALYGGDGVDTIVAGGGQDQLYGNTGDDYIYIGAGNGGATVFGGQGNDVIDASSAPHAVFISGDLGTDIILGSKGSDTIHGGAGSDTIIAASGSTEHIHVGTADSSAASATDTSQLDHITGFGSGDVLVFDGDPAGTSANTLNHGGDASIANFAAAYAYAYGGGTHAAAISGAIEYAVVSDTSGHVYVFAADHAAVELDGLTNGVAGVTAAQLLAA